MNRYQRRLQRAMRRHTITPLQVIGLVALALGVGALVGMALLKDSAIGA